MTATPMREYGGLRLAVTTLTILPLRGGSLDRRTAGRAMAWAPAIGAVLGAAAALGILGLRLVLDQEIAARIVCATFAIGLLAVLTRGLHLDGLADTADSLGVHDRERALAVMKRPDIGAFGVLALVFLLLLQVGGLAAADLVQHGTRVLICAVVAGRIAIQFACVRKVPAARPDGLGALVAGTLPRAVPLLWSVALMATGSVWAYYDDRGGRPAAVMQPVAVVVALVVARIAQVRLVRRLGGITGDVLGAVCEVATTVALVLGAGAPHSFGFPGD